MDYGKIILMAALAATIIWFGVVKLMVFAGTAGENMRMIYVCQHTRAQGSNKYGARCNVYPAE